LDEYGFSLNIKDVFEHVENKKLVGRPHIATAMVEKEYTTYEEAFWHYIGNDKPAYVRKPTFPPEEVIKIIKDAGGIAILAHPGVIKNDFIIPDLVDFGLDGLEVFYPIHSLYQRRTILNLPIVTDFLSQVVLTIMDLQEGTKNSGKRCSKKATTTSS